MFGNMNDMMVRSFTQYDRDRLLHRKLKDDKGFQSHRYSTVEMIMFQDSQYFFKRQYEPPTKLYLK